MLKWTEEKPKERGFYWLNYHQRKTIVKVVNVGDYVGVYMIGKQDFLYTFDSLFDGCFWAGPIEEPEENKDA